MKKNAHGRTGVPAKKGRRLRSKRKHGRRRARVAAAAVTVLALPIAFAACTPPPASGPQGSTCYGTDLDPIIRTEFTNAGAASQIDKAMHIAYRESRCAMGVDTNPTAITCGGSSDNHAMGSFQWAMPCHSDIIWEACENPYGIGPMDLVNDPVCNTRAAARAVATAGWGPWGG